MSDSKRVGLRKTRAARRGWGTTPIKIAVKYSSTEWCGGGVERCGGGSDPQLRLRRAVQISRKIPVWAGQPGLEPPDWRVVMKTRVRRPRHTPAHLRNW